MVAKIKAGNKQKQQETKLLAMLSRLFKMPFPWLLSVPGREEGAFWCKERWAPGEGGPGSL